MSVTEGFLTWKMAVELTPIVLTGGIATNVGDGLPIIALTQPGTSDDPNEAISSGAFSSSLDGAFFVYTPLPGGTLLTDDVGMYPFANQAIAANALIAQPLVISLLMYCPATVNMTFSQRRTAISSLVQSLTLHSSMGGQYSVVTHAYIYTGCLLRNIRDVSGADTHQYQYAWQWDFIQPLTSTDAAAQAQNNLMKTITNQTPVAGQPTWASGSNVQNPTNALLQSLGQPELQGPG